MLDIKRLQYLEAVYRYHNFTRASEELFISQSAISKAIKSLEADRPFAVERRLHL